jgi:hypothetical protein
MKPDAEKLVGCALERGLIGTGNIDTAAEEAQTSRVRAQVREELQQRRLIALRTVTEDPLRSFTTSHRG